MPKDLQRFTELGDLKIIASSRAFHKFLVERSVYLQKKVNTFVREQKFTEAYGELAKLDDIEKLVLVLNNRIKELEKE